MSDANRTILLIEDSEDDAFALHWALKKAKITYPVQVAVDGQQAVDYLAGVGKYVDREAHPIPFLVLLDLKLPYRSGLEVLVWIRQQATLAEIPVVVLSGSDEARDHDSASALGALDYLVKPATPDQLTRLIQQVESGAGATLRASR